MIRYTKAGEGSYHLKIGLGAFSNDKWKTVYEAPTQTADGYTGFLSFASFENRLFATFYRTDRRELASEWCSCKRMGNSSKRMY